MIHQAAHIPEPIVMSPLSSTSWQTTALECMVTLSRLKRFINKNYSPKEETHYIGGMIEGRVGGK